MGIIYQANIYRNACLLSPYCVRALAECFRRASRWGIGCVIWLVNYLPIIHKALGFNNYYHVSCVWCCLLIFLRSRSMSARISWLA